jgi:hypothetical protein
MQVLTDARPNRAEKQTLKDSSSLDKLYSIPSQGDGDPPRQQMLPEIAKGLNHEELADYETLVRDQISKTLEFLEKKKIKLAIFTTMKEWVEGSQDLLVTTFMKVLPTEITIIERLLMNHVRLVHSIVLETSKKKLHKDRSDYNWSQEKVAKKAKKLTVNAKAEFDKLKLQVLEKAPQKAIVLHVKRDASEEKDKRSIILAPALEAIKGKCREILPLLFT